MPNDGRLMFKSRRTVPPPLILTAAMQRDAWAKDAAEACLSRDMRKYNRIIAEAKAGNLAHLDRRQA